MPLEICNSPKSNLLRYQKNCSLQSGLLAGQGILPRASDLAMCFRNGGHGVEAIHLKVLALSGCRSPVRFIRV